MKHSKLPWRLIELPEAGLLFIQADKNKSSDPYHIEIMGDDTNEDLYPLEQKKEDAKLIIKAVNNHDMLVEALERSNKELQKITRLAWGNDYLQTDLDKALNQTPGSQTTTNGIKTTIR